MIRNNSVDDGRILMGDCAGLIKCIAGRRVPLSGGGRLLSMFGTAGRFERCRLNWLSGSNLYAVGAVFCLGGRQVISGGDAD